VGKMEIDDKRRVSVSVTSGDITNSHKSESRGSASTGKHQRA
jgi:hypothetical protein